MRRFSDTAKTSALRAPRPMPAALFPESAGARSIRCTEGLLRAPPRGKTPRPLLSAWAVTVADTVPTADSVLAERGWETLDLLRRAANARRALVAARVGGAWWQGDDLGAWPPGDGYALVALAETPVPGSTKAPDERIAAAMLDRALAENPADPVMVLTSGAARPHRAIAAAPGAVVIEGAIDPWALLGRATRVYSTGGEIGFLALLAGIPVSAFGAAFYTGWGVTEDDADMPPRPYRRSVDEIFAGACLVAARYRDPFRNRSTSFEEVLAILAEWRRLEEANRRIAVCVGMSFWKRRRIAEFVRSTQGVPPFRRSVAGALAAAARAGSAAPGAIAGWASRLPDGLVEAAAQHHVPLIRVEDGFIRSVGLGSDFTPPASLVFDEQGMYFDPRGESDLERLLRDAEFSPDLLTRAKRLAAQLVARGVTKYNLAADGAGLDVPPGRRSILVPGQVEDDLSIRFGAGAVRTNLALLAAVRAANLDAFVIYKPHPDVLAGHRTGAVPEPEARRFADAVVPGGSLAALLAMADELHTMTSLAGFEALLRGKPVVVYGRPFYAGWGLTTDVEPFERGRRLSLKELVAGTLVLYPRYLDPLTRLPCGPEVIVERLDDPELWRPGPLVLARRLQGALARRLGMLRAMLPSVGAASGGGVRERPRP